MPLSLRLIFVIIALAAAFGPVVAFALAQKKRRKFEKDPFQESYPRPAGESLRIKIADLDEQIGDLLLLTVISPLAIGIGGFFYLSHIHGPNVSRQAFIVLLVTVVFSLFQWRKVFRLSKERSDYRLGFEGERFVGQHLNGLLKHGFEVFHDLPFDGFNIDHVVLGPTGVYSVETKTRRKRVYGTQGKADYRIRYDGRDLHYPWGVENFGLEQSLRNSATLSDWLSKAVGERVSAQPVLVFPGWFVTTERFGPVSVLNPKGMLSLVTRKNAPSLDENLRKRISHQLTQRSVVEAKNA